MAEIEQTQIVTRAREIDLVTGDRLHCLELLIGDEVEKRIIISPLGVKIGRTAPADLILADSEISRTHCMVALLNEELYVSDMNSTNGTFVDGERARGATVLPVGSILQVGHRKLKHEWRTRTEIEHSDDFDRELQRAASYVKALLPPPIAAGPIRTEWFYLPSAKLGGDAFGYGPLTDELFLCYLVDVAGHGAGAAMHAVAIMNQLRQRSLPNTDMAQPEEVLSTLNELFQMENYAGLYFTIWYGVYNRHTRRLDYASGGHHPAYLLPPGRTAAIPLYTRNVMMGAMPAMDFRQASVHIPPGAVLSIFSDGVYEIIDREGLQWSIGNFVELLKAPDADSMGEPQRLYDRVSAAADPDTLDDDFSLVMLTFD